MENSEILDPKDFNIIRVSDKKIRIKYKIPLYFHEENDTIFLGYHSIGITMREIVDENDKLNQYIKFGIHYRKPLMYACYRPFDKFFNKISNIYSVKKINLHMSKFPYFTNFEEKETYFIIPKMLFFKGDDVKWAIRKWKIKKFLNTQETTEITDV